MYLDVYFVCSSICNYMALSCALRRYGLPRRRRAIAALCGALGACLWEILLPSELLRPLIALFLSIIMLRISAGKRPQQGSDLARLYLYAFLLNGLILFMQQYLSLWIGAVGLSYLVLRLILQKSNEQKSGRYIELTITPQESKTVAQAEDDVLHIKALIDSGHQLREPVTGRPVVVVSRSSCNLPATVPLPCQTVQGSTLLFGFWPAKLCIGTWEYKRHEVLVAIADDWKEPGCQALVPAYLLEEGKELIA